MSRTARSLAFSRLAEFAPRAGAEGGYVNTGLIEVSVCEAMIEAATQEGLQRGYDTGRAEAMAEADARIAQLEASFSEQIAQARDQWQRELGERLIDDVIKSRDALSQELSERLSPILEPWIDQQIRRRSSEDLERAVLRVASEGSKLTVRGPQDLVDHVLSCLNERNLAADAVVSAEAGLQLSIDETIITHHLEQWMADLKAVAA